MEERILRFVFILVTCILIVFYVIGDDFGDEKITEPETGEPLRVCDERCIYYLLGDAILYLLRAGLHLLWFYYTLF